MNGFNELQNDELMKVEGGGPIALIIIGVAALLIGTCGVGTCVGYKEAEKESK